jgi:hypothetical protein
MDKKTVLEFFWSLPESLPEQFNKAFELYKLAPGKNLNIERTLNTGGYNAYNLQTVLHELQQCHGIKDIEKIAPAVEDLEPAQVEHVPVKDAQPSEELLETVNDQDKGQEGLPHNPAQSFREEYPFLNDPDCPNELKILATDKITAWKSYQAAHEQLTQINAGTLEVSEEEKLQLAKTATDAFARSESIKAELDNYQEKKEVLGKDPIFRTLTLEREVADMDSTACLAFIKSTVSYKSRKLDAIEKAVSDELKAKLQGELDGRLEKLALVNKKLGISNGQ